MSGGVCPTNVGVVHSSTRFVNTVGVQRIERWTPSIGGERRIFRIWHGRVSDLLFVRSPRVESNRLGVYHHQSSSLANHQSSYHQSCIIIISHHPSVHQSSSISPSLIHHSLISHSSFIHQVISISHQYQSSSQSSQSSSVLLIIISHHQSSLIIISYHSHLC